MLESPEFSLPGGFYRESFLLELKIDDPNSKIYYTLDGSEPTESSNLYTGPIKIDNREGDPNIYSEIPNSPSFKIPDGEVFKSTVVRAKVFNGDGKTSRTATHTYIVDEKNKGSHNRYSLPVISITTDADNLFDYDYGIMVPGVNSLNQYSKTTGNYFQRGTEWERPIHIEFYEPDGDLGFSQDAGLRVHGGATRYLRNKSLRIYAGDLYDSKDMFYYPIFPGLIKPGSSESLTQFKCFVLRNSGHDYNHSYFRDAIMQTLVSDLGFETQAYRPAVVLINGEYWGIYNIRERYDEWYFATNYNIENDKVVLLDGSKAEVKTGNPEDNNHYLEMVKFIKDSADSGKINNPDIYEYINTLMDVDSFINYFAAEIFFRNTDWPNNNIGFWRERTETYEPDAPYGRDGRWRWMMFDTDWGFSLWGQPAESNTLEHAAERDGLFSSLLENEEFKYQFINTMADLLNSIFKTEYTIKTIEETQSILSPEMLEHLKRWIYMDTSIENWNGEVNQLIEFAIDRPSFQIQHITGFFSLPGTADINLITDTGKGYIKINSLELKEETPGIDNPDNWKGTYFKEVPIKITAIPNPGYEFKNWIGVDNNNSNITITLEDNLSLTAVFAEK